MATSPNTPDPKLLAEAASQAAKLTTALERAKNIMGQLSSTEEEVLDISKKIEKSYRDLAESIHLREQGERKELSYSQQLQKQAEKLKQNLKDQQGASAKLTAEYQKQLQANTQQDSIVSNQKSIVSQLEQQVKRARGANRIALQDQLDIEREILADEKKKKEVVNDIVKGLIETIKAQQKLNDLTEDEVKKLEKATKTA